jgi:uncharacterized protein YdeI (YjbR/CyaY-like superfamily)
MNPLKVKLAETAEPKISADISRALAATPSVQTFWLDLTPIGRRDFISWIESAKQVQTRKRRIEVACSKLAAGQRRPCCYEVIPMKLYKALGTNAVAQAQWKTLSPDERRDFANWIDPAKENESNMQRITQACAMLESGSRQP